MTHKRGGLQPSTSGRLPGSVHAFPLTDAPLPGGGKKKKKKNIYSGGEDRKKAELPQLLISTSTHILVLVPARLVGTPPYLIASETRFGETTCVQLTERH